MRTVAPSTDHSEKTTQTNLYQTNSGMAACENVPHVLGRSRAASMCSGCTESEIVALSGTTVLADVENLKKWLCARLERQHQYRKGKYHLNSKSMTKKKERNKTDDMEGEVFCAFILSGNSYHHHHSNIYYSRSLLRVAVPLL